jgi:hypothetical protein
VTEGRKKLVTLVFVLIAIFSYYLIVTLPPAEQYKGWVAREGDEVEYYVEAELNSGSTYVASLLGDYGLSSGSTLAVRATKVPTDVNVSAIAGYLLTLNGIVQVEQRTGQEWVHRNSSLPFFLPVGYWESIEETLGEQMDVTIEQEWWGEMSLTASHSSSELGNVGLFLAWEITDGVLQGMTINASAPDGWDFVRLALSGQRLAYETDLNWLSRSIGRNLISLLLIVGALGPFVLIGLLWKLEVRARLTTPLTGTLAERLEIYGREYLFVWSLGVLISALSGIIAIQFIEESISPVIQSYLLSFLLGTLVSLYRARRIDSTPAPLEVIQYCVTCVAASISGLFIVNPGEVADPIAYALPLVLMVGMMAILFLMHPLRAIRSRIELESDELVDASNNENDDYPNEYSL